MNGRGPALVLATAGAAVVVALAALLAGGAVARALAGALLLTWAAAEAAARLLRVTYRLLDIDPDVPPVPALVAGALAPATIAVVATAFAAVGLAPAGPWVRALGVPLAAAAATLAVVVPFAGGVHALATGAAALLATAVFALAPAWAAPWARPLMALLDRGPWGLP